MADDVRKTKLVRVPRGARAIDSVAEVVFSWNEGQSWYDFELSSMPVEVGEARVRLFADRSTTSSQSPTRPQRSFYSTAREGIPHLGMKR